MKFPLKISCTMAFKAVFHIWAIFVTMELTSLFIVANEWEAADAAAAPGKYVSCPGNKRI